MTAQTDAPEDHPIDCVLEMLGRLRSCADLVETVTDSAGLPLIHQSQFYTVADTIRRICKEADAQAFLVCDELNGGKK